MAKQFFIIDGSSYVYRAFYAIRELSNSAGLPTNATYGFTKMLLKIINEKKPDYLAIAFDAKGDTFRNELYKDYKAHRPPMPDALAQQIPYIHLMVGAFQIPLLLETGLEADDLIGTLAKKGEEAGLSVVIVTGDKDMYQLITPRVTVYDSMKNQTYTELTIQEKFGITPGQIVDMMGLMGDAVDNIPGVKGIGEKTAMQLIQTFGTLENLLGRIEEVKRPKQRELLESQQKMARLSRELATIKTDCEIPFYLETFELKAPDSTQLRSLCLELEFLALLKELVPGMPENESAGSSSGGGTISTAPEVVFQTIDEKGLSSLISEIKSDGVVALSLLSSDPPEKCSGIDAAPLGLAFAIGSGRLTYLPLQNTLENGASPTGPRSAMGDTGFPASLKHLLSSGEILVYGHDLKHFLTILKRQGLPFKGRFFDVKIAAYLINPMKRDYTLEGLAFEYLKEQAPGGAHSLFPKPAAPQNALQNDADADIAITEKCREASLIFRLSKMLEPKLESQSLKTLFEDMEMPLVFVLSDIEQNGVKIDSERLENMSKELEVDLALITKKIYDLAGGEFNINSPKQLAEILFNRLGLKPTKKTKTGYSTNEDVLTQLSLQHPLPAEILNSRQIVKLKSTYIDALPKLVHPRTGRIHTQLNQCATATGRLSSTEPNLQNIPIRGALGYRIREAFIAEPGNLLLSADYNQIELRLLAHLSGDAQLLAAFKNGDDVHTRTAMELFDLPREAVTQEMRRAAKSVNFGIIYGISPFGLGNNIGVSMAEAKRYIERYFALYHGVQVFIERTLKEATEKGYVTTIFDRRREIPELASSNSFTRGVGERLAINTPLQGSAADIIKAAMIHIWRWMAEAEVKSLMTLQIHDELIFDVPEDEVPLMKEKIKALMEGALQLSVPLTVDIGVGKNWAEAH